MWNLLFRRVRQYSDADGARKVPGAPPPLAGEGQGGCLVSRRSRSFERVHGLQNRHLDRRRLPGEFLAVRLDTDDESVVVWDGQLRLYLLDDSGRLGRVHDIRVATDANQGDIGLDLFDVGIRITVTREPVAIPVETQYVSHPVVALRVGLKPMLDGAVGGHGLELDAGDVQGLTRLDRLDIAREAVRDITRSDELRRFLANLLDVRGLEVIGVRMRDEDHVGGLLLGSQAPGVDVYGDPVALPLVGGLLVPRELLEHGCLLLGLAARRF